MKSEGSKLISFQKPKRHQWTLLMLLVLELISVAQGFQQELWLYFKDGSNGLYFDSHVPDTAQYNPLLGTTDRYCARGSWATFEDADFSTYSGSIGSPDMSDLFCGTLNSTALGSFRHWAANETSIDSISLYSESDFGGNEILVTGRTYGGITHTINYLAASGNADWTLFEGLSLDGKSLCLEVPWINTSYFNWASPQFDLGLTTIGSVFKGCDEEEIQMYRENQSN